MRDHQLQEQAQWIADREGKFQATATKYRAEATQALDHMEVKTVQERLEAQRTAQSAEARAQSSRQAAVSAREEAQRQIL